MYQATTYPIFQQDANFSMLRGKEQKQKSENSGNLPPPFPK